jgi:hypothetical protein
VALQKRHEVLHCVFFRVFGIGLDGVRAIPIRQRCRKTTAAHYRGVAALDRTLPVICK